MPRAEINELFSGCGDQRQGEEKAPARANHPTIERIGHSRVHQRDAATAIAADVLMIAPMFPEMPIPSRTTMSRFVEDSTSSDSRGGESAIANTRETLSLPNSFLQVR